MDRRQTRIQPAKHTATATTFSIHGDALGHRQGSPTQAGSQAERTEETTTVHTTATAAHNSARKARRQNASRQRQRSPTQARREETLMTGRARNRTPEGSKHSRVLGSLEQAGQRVLRERRAQRAVGAALRGRSAAHVRLSSTTATQHSKEKPQGQRNLTTAAGTNTAADARQLEDRTHSHSGAQQKRSQQAATRDRAKAPQSRQGETATAHEARGK